MANPNRPTEIRQLTAQELKSMLDRDDQLELFDVRTDAEREIARIAGARHLDEAGVEYVKALDRDTPLIFHCHHGIRSQAAAEYFVAQGFTNVCNLAGGIEAWSLAVDPTIRRY